MKIFGTDGVRGISNVYPMTAELVLKLGMAAAIIISTKLNRTNRILIGKDTRLSGYLYENALTAGLISMGKEVILVGPMPTPAVAFLTRSMRADMGIMISASHNLYKDNGIKLFDNLGYKISDEDEKAIESLLDKDLDTELVASEKVGRAYRLRESSGRYIEFVKNCFSNNFMLSNLKIVLDCANGAAYKVAPVIFYELGAKEIIEIGNSPNGININDNCGSTSIESVRKKLLESQADVGIAFDGDADRVILIDEKGDIVDGDVILALLATKWKKDNKIKDNKIVSTVMANMAFEKYINEIGLTLIRTQVGDRYVVEELRKSNLNLGGEPSGHLILRDYNTTGDGIIGALEVLSIMGEKGKKLSEVANLFKSFPQILKNIKVKNSNILENLEVKKYIDKLTNDLKNSCRILVRKSGTENLIRVMVESDDFIQVESVSNNIIDYLSKMDYSL
jgi:phosphoglucosamine mutase